MRPPRSILVTISIFALLLSGVSRASVNYQARGADEMYDLFVDGIKSSLRLRVYVTGICNLNGYSEISAVSASPN